MAKKPNASALPAQLELDFEKHVAPLGPKDRIRLAIRLEGWAKMLRGSQAKSPSRQPEAKLTLPRLRRRALALN